MIKNIFSHIYPFFAIGIIEIGKIVDNFQNWEKFLILIFQILIGILTIVKIYYDIKTKQKNLKK